MTALEPKVSICIVRTDDGVYGLDVQFRGLETEAIASALVDYIRANICGEEIAPPSEPLQ